MDDIETYLAEHPLRQGKLSAWEKEIISLRRAGASYRYICRFLASKQVVAHPGEVQRFMKRCGREQLAPPTTRITVKQPDADPGSLPKFDWPPKNKGESSW